MYAAKCPITSTTVLRHTAATGPLRMIRTDAFSRAPARPHTPPMQPANANPMLERHSYLWQRLRDWVAEGVRPDPGDAPELVGLDVTPPERILRMPKPRNG